jgi:importin subunit beta-1
VKGARKGAAQAVSALAIIELKKQQWGEVITILQSNALGDTLEYKLSSLETLGYICEELQAKVLTEVQVDSILTALVSNITPQVANDDVKLAGITALNFCIQYCEKNFRVESEKGTLLENIISNCASPNSEIRLKAAQCILEVVRCYYDFLGIPALEQIAAATFHLIRTDDVDEVALVSVEVWCSLCDEEIERMKHETPERPVRNYISTAYDSLMGLLFDGLKKKSANDEGDWNVSVASACCLDLVARIAKDLVVAKVLAYVHENIGSSDWKLRDAAMLAFASILRGPQKETVNGIIGQAIPFLQALLNDPKPQVRETTAWTFSKISENNYEALENYLSTLVPSFIASLKDKPRISNQVCFALHNLAESLRQREGETSSKMSPFFKDVLAGLWENGFREDAYVDNVNLASSSFAAFSNVIQYSSGDVEQTTEFALQLLITEFDNTLNGSFKYQTKIEEYQGYFCSAMQTALIKLAGKIAQPLVAHIVDSISKSFEIRKAVYDEGILAFGGLITAVGKEFNVYMERFGPFLVYALQNVADAALCRVSVGCVGDLARALEQQMANYLGQLMPFLMDILRNAETERTVKLIIITVLSDLALATNKYFFPYLKEVLEILGSAAELSLSPPQEVICFY